MGTLLKDKVALVTGGGRGIGRGVCLALAGEGARVAVVSRTESHVLETVAEIERRGGRAVAVIADISRLDDVERAVAETLAAFGRIDILVNNASAGHGMTPLQDISDEEFYALFEAAPLATFRMMRACFPSLRDNRGKVINFGSPGAMEGMAGMAAYATAKEGIRGLSKVAAREWGPLGINVNVIAPAALSASVARYRDAFPDVYAEAVARRPLGREGDPEQDIGRVVLFLAGPDSDYLTGECIQAAGGFLIVP